MGVREMARTYIESEGPAKQAGPLSDDQIETEEETTGFFETERAGQSLVDQGIGIMVAVIVIGAVAIPVSIEVINKVNVSGTTGTILNYVPLALGVGLFVAAISIVR